MPQIIRSMLSMQRGENVFRPKQGMRFFEYFEQFAGSVWLSELMKIDVIRQMSIPRLSSALGTVYTPLQCVTRVRRLELLSETPADHRLPIRLDIEVQGLGARQLDLSIYMPTSDQMLERAKLMEKVQRDIADAEASSRADLSRRPAG